MRNSRILKLFSYIMLPIFVGILIISIFYIQVKDATYYDEEKYFESESFMSLYMTRLSGIARKLIYKNPEYKNIEDLVEASKVSTGNVKLQIEKINIVELLNQAIGEFEDKFEAKKLEILLEAKESEIYILADSRYMYRIVENLFSNISKYALENSRVYIDIIKKSNEVYIEMKNISKEKLNISAEELMQRFVRGDKSRTTEGSGLGISIAQNLTEIQKGVFNLKLDGDLFRVELIFNIL